MFDIDYLTDSMKYIPVSLENQTNPHACTSEVTNSAGTLLTPNATTSEEENEAEELIVVPTAVKHTAEKVGPRKSSTNSKAEEFLTEFQNLNTQEKEAYSTSILEDTPEILAFRKQLDKLAQKHSMEVPKNKATSTNSVNSGSRQDNTQPADQDDLDMPELTIFNKPQKGIFDEASYDDKGVVHDFNNFPTKVAVSPIPTLRIHNIHPQSQILGDPKSFVQTRSRVQQPSGAHALEEPKKISEALKDDSWVKAMQEELLQFRLQQKPEESAGFAKIVDFLKGSHIKYALTHNPTIHDSLVKQFWQTATASTLADGTLKLRATIDTLEYTINEASVRSKLQLADALGITMLPNTEIFEGMGNMGYPTNGSFTFWKSFFIPQWRFLVYHILHCISPKSGGWDQFGSNIATTLICLSTGKVYSFSKLIFDGMVANLKSKTKFLMYPRFLQMILEIQTESKHPYLAVALTKKIFGNMKRGFRGVPRPLLPVMLPVVAQNTGQADQARTQSQPSSSTVPPPPTS
ncbi:hypothetical protein Tco_1115107 [Tanacetum coccineum]